MFAILCLLHEKVADVRSPDISKYNLNQGFSSRLVNFHS